MRYLLLSCCFVIVLSCAGCASSNSGAATVYPGLLPQVDGPNDQSVPMGLSGTFAVQAVGQSLQYQWQKNGTDIVGATSAAYVTPATAFADDGEVFTVRVTNPYGTTGSSTAHLTVTARAPKAGDLRFQQVDSASTVNGYQIASLPTFSSVVFCPQPQGPLSIERFSPAISSPLFTQNLGCGWPFEVFNAQSGLSVTAASVSWTNFDENATDLTPALFDGNAVLTSINVASGYAGYEYVTSGMANGFASHSQVIDANQLQAAATSEAQQGRVITAVAIDGTQVTYYAYSWTGDAQAVYEAKTSVATVDTITDEVQKLAAGGYIVTAISGSGADDGNGVIMVGTRVLGDTKPRPTVIGEIATGTVDSVFAKGYAIVAVSRKLAGSNIIAEKFIGER